MPFNVLHLRSSFDPGGTETLLLQLFNHPQRCFRMHFALLKDGSLIERLDQSAGNVVHRLFRRRMWDGEVIKQLEALVREHDIRIVHVHQPIELFYAVRLRLRLPRLRILYHIHLMFARRDLTFYLARLLSRRFAEVVTVSQSTKNELVESFGFRPEDITVVYNGTTFAESPPLSEAEIHALLPVAPRPERFNVVTVANFVWGKDHETVFRAYNDYIREQLPKVSFYFIGRESEISSRLVERYLRPEDIESGRIVLCGAIPNARTLLPAFDLVLMSSFSETFNLALVEAAGAGMPVLASDIAIFRELSEEGRYFRLFRMGDAADLVEQLRGLMELEPEERGGRHAAHFREAFSIGRVAEDLCNLYQGKKVESALPEENLTKI